MTPRADHLHMLEAVLMVNKPSVQVLFFRITNKKKKNLPGPKKQTIDPI
jgi:hypothetical protein